MISMGKSEREREREIERERQRERDHCTFETLTERETPLHVSDAYVKN